MAAKNHSSHPQEGNQHEGFTMRLNPIMDSLVSVYGNEVAARLRNGVNGQPVYSEHVVVAVLRTLALQTGINQKQVLQAINNALNGEKNTPLASGKTSQIGEDSANSANDSLPYTLQA